MLTDRYDLSLSTPSPAARDAYVEGCDLKLTAHPGAIELFDRAIAADPGFALAHAAKAHALLERGEGAAAQAAIAAAKSLTDGISEREVSHVGFFAVLLSGDGAAALSALRAHLDAWPRDTMVLATAAFTNGLIGSFRPRRAEAHAAGIPRSACPELRRRLVVHRASRHGSVGEWRTRGGRPEDRPLAGPEPEKSLGSACPWAPLL